MQISESGKAGIPKNSTAPSCEAMASGLLSNVEKLNALPPSGTRLVRVLTAKPSTITPKRKKKSAKRVTINAFFDAWIAAGEL